MRWRLTAQHYLNVPGTEWEQKETDRNTGKQARKVFAVPALLNPDDPSDQNYPGEIVVCHEGKGQGRDITFIGDPTPDMEPLDDEAKALSATFADKWNHPVESLAAQGADYGAQLVAMFEKQMGALSVKSAPSGELDALKKQIADLTARLDAKPAAALKRA